MSEINIYNHLTVYGVEKWINDRMEYLFHFVRDTKEFKSNMDVVRVPYAESSIIRSKSPVKTQKKASIYHS